MGGQLALCLPKHDLILITTADNQAVSNGTEYIIDAYFNLVDKVNKLADKAMPDNTKAQKVLREKISSLAIPLPQGNKTTINAASYSGRRYIMQENQMGFKWMSVDIEPEKCTVRYANTTGEHSIVFGMGHYAAQKFPEKYFGAEIGILDTYYDSVAAGAWRDGKTLLGTIYAIDNYLGTLKMQLTFSDDNLCVFMAKAAEWFFDNYQGFATAYSEN
jgi:hypothetical protein